MPTIKRTDNEVELPLLSLGLIIISFMAGFQYGYILENHSVTIALLGMISSILFIDIAILTIYRENGKVKFKIRW